MIERALASLLAIGLVAAVAGAGTLAYFSDTETSAGNTYTAGVLDLLVNGKNDPNIGAVVVVEDLKPSIPRYQNITLTLSNNPGRLWFHNLRTGSPWCTNNIVTEAELAEDPSGTKNDLTPVTDFDLKAGGNVIIAPEDGIPFANISSCWIPLGVFGAPGQTTTIIVEESFHMRPYVTNWAQGDKCTFKQQFGVSQVNDSSPPYNPDVWRVWDPVKKMCVGGTLG